MRRRSLRLALLAAAFCFANAPASAIVNGVVSELAPHMVQVIGNGKTPNCSGVAIDRRHVLTAHHCGAWAVVADGKRILSARPAQTARLDDGKIVKVNGDVVILTLRTPLPAAIVPIAIGEANEQDGFVIAGFGAVSEAERGKLGPLHEARVVLQKPLLLVDPFREGNLSASACYGDSGGAVVQGGVLVGIIVRVSHPDDDKVCGHLTHYMPVAAYEAASAGTNAAAHSQRRRTARRITPR